MKLTNNDLILISEWRPVENELCIVCPIPQSERRPNLGITLGPNLGITLGLLVSSGPYVIRCIDPNPRPDPGPNRSPHPVSSEIMKRAHDPIQVDFSNPVSSGA